MTALRLSASTMLLFTSLFAARDTAAQSTRTPVLVELFTSEGCSSCPPADALLAKLEHEQPVAGAEIIVLGEHVDYWDRLGWRDRFSSHQFTERQSQYSGHFHLDDIYTPQMVVNGSAQFVGNDAQSANRAIVRAAQGKTLPLTLTGTKLQGNHLSATVGLGGQAPAGAQGDLYAALVSPMETTQVRSGENGGQTLHHVGVVRSLIHIGTMQALLRGPVSFEVPAIEAASAMRLVVFAQSEGSGSILGAVSVPAKAGVAHETVAAAR